MFYIITYSIHIIFFILYNRYSNESENKKSAATSSYEVKSIQNDIEMNSTDTDSKFCLTQDMIETVSMNVATLEKNVYEDQKNRDSGRCLLN